MSLFKQIREQPLAKWDLQNKTRIEGENGCVATILETAEYGRGQIYPWALFVWQDSSMPSGCG